MSLLTAAKPTKAPDAREGGREGERPRAKEKDENATNRRIEGRKRIEWVENYHLFRSRRTRVSTRTRARSPRSCPFSRDAFPRASSFFGREREKERKSARMEDRSRVDKNSTEQRTSIVCLCRARLYPAGRRPANFLFCVRAKTRIPTRDR